MPDLTTKNFGILIAYVLPGFLSLWALQPYSATLRVWLAASATLPAGIEAVAFSTAASITAGMGLSAVRWLLVDTAMRRFGVVRPEWDDARYAANRDAFESLVDAHFRYYQFYAHTALVLPLFAVRAAVVSSSVPMPVVWFLFVMAEGTLLLAAHDALSRYYARTERLLGSTPPTKGRTAMTNGHQKPVREKPAAAKPEGAPKAEPAAPKNAGKPT